MQYEYANGIGQDSHRFLQPCERQSKKADAWPKQLILGGVVFEGETPLVANSDGDVVLHALTNAISGVSGVNILGTIADNMCRDQGIKDSSAYLAKALSFASEKGWELTHISISIEALKPKMAAKIGPMKMRIGELTGIDSDRIGITATSGEHLSRFGEGDGIMVFCSVTMRRPEMET
ncbi:MAG: 2-C-methyl-D-erythritol 2,4-cyclodiphosphate synthase [Clostridiales bacterium]|nr:2-C-methyl-D-erythritol 2,4-cyclodiphosphate synthase [Clostridiales bacterium]